MLTIVYILLFLINLICSIAFIYLLFVSIKLIKEHKGPLFATIFFIGVLSLLGKPSSNETSETVEWESPQKQQIERQWKTSRVTLQNFGISSININISYGIDTLTKRSMPYSAYSSFTGFTQGIEWVPESIELENLTDKSFRYAVYGKIKWKLFRITMYTQHKNFTGTYTY